MLPKINRLKNTKDIERVFKGGQGLKAGFLFIKAVKNDLKASRFAFIVSKKVASKAVQRNQTKRRLRGIIREAVPRIKAGFDIVVVAQRGINEQDFQDIKKDTLTALDKIKLIIY